MTAERCFILTDGWFARLALAWDVSAGLRCSCNGATVTVATVMYGNKGMLLLLLKYCFFSRLGHLRVARKYLTHFCNMYLR